MMNIFTQEFNSVTENFTARLKQANLARKIDIANFVKEADFDNNELKDVTSNKNEWNKLSKKVKAISTKELTKGLINKFSILNGARYFSSGIFQNYIVFIPAKKYIKYFSWTTWIDLWKFNGIPEENIENITKSDSNFAPDFVDHYLLPDITLFCLINNSISIPKKVLDLYISYIVTPWLRNLNIDFTLNNCFFGSVNLIKNADPGKCKYSGYSIRFDSCSEFLFTDGSMGRNVTIFGADMSSSVHVDNKNKDILFLGEGPTQGLYDITFTAEARYCINFKQPNKRFVLSLHYNGSNSLLFVNATKISQFKAKNSEIRDCTLLLGTILKVFTISNMKTVGLGRVVKFFSVDFNPINTNNILDIHKYLMKKHDTKNVWVNYENIYWIINGSS